MTYSRHRPETKIFVKDGLYRWLIDAESNMHLNGALTMSEVVHFLLCHIMDIAENCREIVLSHVLKGKLPELFVLVWIIVSMCS